ncbi:hypothetical protein ACROYT_G014699 [Oculina patagonica]
MRNSLLGSAIHILKADLVDVLSKAGMPYTTLNFTHVCRGIAGANANSRSPSAMPSGRMSRYALFFFPDNLKVGKAPNCSSSHSSISISSPLQQGSHGIASRMRMSVLIASITYWRNVCTDNGEKTDSTTNLVKVEEKISSADMASVLQGLPSSLTHLAEVSKAQTKAFNSLRDDLLLHPNPDEEDEEVDLDKTSNSLDITAATNQFSQQGKHNSQPAAAGSSQVMAFWEDRVKNGTSGKFITVKDEEVVILRKQLPDVTHQVYVEITGSTEYRKELRALFHVQEISEPMVSTGSSMCMDSFVFFVHYVTEKLTQHHEYEEVKFSVSDMPSCLECYRRFIRQNVYSQSTSTCQNVMIAHAKCDLLEENIIVQYSWLKDHTEFPGSLKVTEDRQYRERELLHISDVVISDGANSKGTFVSKVRWADELDNM